jgi:hypothetical protein
MRDFSVKVSNLYLIIIISGFIFVSILPNMLGLSDASFSILYRAIVLLLAVFIIIFSILSKQAHRLNITRYILFFSFWSIYSIRILYDLLYKEIFLDPEKSASEYLQFAFGVVLIPTVAVIVIKHKNLNYDFVLKWIYRILFVSLLIAIITRGKEVSGRDAGELEIGILLFGQYGTSLSLLSLFLIIRNKFNIISIFYILGFILGFIAIFISASKSPFLALMLVIVIFLLFRFGPFKFIFTVGFLSLLLYHFFIDIMLLLGNYYNSVFLDRLLYAIEIGGDEARGKLIQAGFNEFLNNPFVGSAMLIQVPGFVGGYPHNLIVEAFMALGFFGGILFLFYILQCIKLSIKIIGNNLGIAWIALLFLQFLIFGMFSGNLFSSNLFWLMSVLLVGMSSMQIKKMNTHWRRL